MGRWIVISLDNMANMYQEIGIDCAVIVSILFVMRSIA